ncbi:MAG: hydroxymethylbilane synthase [Bryobacteraceae bacterium]
MQTLPRLLTIGSRGSQLALWQARHVASLLRGMDIESRIEIIKTTGDRLPTAALIEAGGKGLFTKEIEDALLDGSIDLAVHSLKDLPTGQPEGLTIAAIPEREDPRDAIAGCQLESLPHGARVGTSSERRRAQLLALRPDLDVQPVRGNVDTRIRKLKEGRYAAIVLALAGLRRLGLENEAAQILTPDQMCPAAGQGALAIETRSGDAAVCLPLDHEPTRQAVACERAILGGLGGGCHLPVGAFAQVQDGWIQVQAVAVSPDGVRLARASANAASSDGIELAAGVVRDLLAQGAGEWIL